jgi:hypothetical protein
MRSTEASAALTDSNCYIEKEVGVSVDRRHTCALAHLHTCTPVHSTPLAKTWLDGEPIITSLPYQLCSSGFLLHDQSTHLLTDSMFSVMQLSRDQLL